jgi:4-hydroxybenzoate polyprenyltransferase
MSAALIAALFFTVLLLVITTYFFLGSAPLLILKHDTPKDFRFVRGFFNTYYLAATFIMCAAAVSYAFAGKPVFVAGAVALALLLVALRLRVISRMEALGTRIQGGDSNAIKAFRRTHAAAILFNVAQLVLIIWSLVALPPL